MNIEAISYAYFTNYEKLFEHARKYTLSQEEHIFILSSIILSMVNTDMDLRGYIAVIQYMITFNVPPNKPIYNIRTLAYFTDYIVDSTPLFLALRILPGVYRTACIMFMLSFCPSALETTSPRGETVLNVLAERTYFDSCLVNQIIGLVSSPLQLFMLFDENVETVVDIAITHENTEMLDIIVHHNMDIREVPYTEELASYFSSIKRVRYNSRYNSRLLSCKDAPQVSAILCRLLPLEVVDIILGYVYGDVNVQNKA
jgi:hypothetical protein